MSQTVTEAIYLGASNRSKTVEFVHIYLNNIS
jgi:hypothetical protein